MAQPTSSIALEINQPLAKVRALWGCHAPFTRHESEVFALLEFTPRETGPEAFQSTKAVAVI